MIRKILAIIVALVFTGCSPPPEVQADVQIRTAYYDAVEQNFPIRAAANDWNENPVGIRLVRVPECKAPLEPCVSITQYNVKWFIQSGGVYYMDTEAYQDSTGNWQQWRHGFIDLKYAPGLTYAERRMMVCHEFGHYLQVAHYYRDCMRAWVRRYSTRINPNPYPSQVSLDAVKMPFDFGW